MARTSIESQLHAPQPPISGDLGTIPLPQLLFAHAAAGSTGTLRLSDEVGAILARLRLEAGTLVAASVASPEAGLLASVIPLCARAEGRFTFAHGPDDLDSAGQVVRGKVDALALIAAAMRGPVREDAVEIELLRLGNAPLWRNPRVDLERYAFGPQELALVRMLDRETLSVSQLLADPPCSPNIARRVLYVLSITRALSAPPRAGDRQVSGMIARQTPPPPPRSARPLRGAEPTLVTPRVSVPPLPSMRAPRFRSASVATPRPPTAPSKRPPAGRYHMQDTSEERVVGAAPRAGAPRRALPSALAWRDELRERARLAPKQSCYEVLGVARDCEAAQLHEAHAALLSRFEPESLPDDGEDVKHDAAVVLDHARRALDILGDSMTRVEYDRASDAVGGGAVPVRALRRLHAEACYRRAEGLWKRRDYAGAQAAVERALSLEGSVARYEALLGLLLHLRSGSGEGGRVHPNALRHLEQALRLDPRSEQANYAMALVLKRAGRHDAAYEHFHRVWRLNPQNLEAAREVRLHVMRNRKSSSGRLIDRLLGRPPSKPVKPGRG